MSKKDKYCKLIEKYVNGSKKKLMEDIYGKNYKFEVKNLTYSIKNKTCLVEVKIRMGDEFDELSLDSESIINDFVRDAADAVFPKMQVATLVSFDI
jgi:hypothetical protein